MAAMTPASHKYCASCGFLNAIESAFCVDCGAQFAQPKKKGGFISAAKELFYYLQYCYRNGKKAPVIYFIILCIIPVLHIFVVLFSIYFISRSGQRDVCQLIGAKKIVRQEHEVSIRQPVETIIRNARAQGMDLPDDIEIYVMQSEMPVAYAVGMNSLVVSENFAEYPEHLEAEVMFELYRIHEKASNLLLLMIGSNILAVFCAAIAMVIGYFTMNYGDRRRDNSFFGTGESEAGQGVAVFIGAIAVMVLFLAVTVWIMKKTVRKDVFAADRYMTSQDRFEVHSNYLDCITKNDDSLVKKALTCGFPDVDERIGAMQMLSQAA